MSNPLASHRSLPTPSPATLAGRIKAERIRLGLTQDAAAERLRISRRSYRQLEVNANPRYSTQLGLVMDLGMNGQFLFPKLFAGEGADGDGHPGGDDQFDWSGGAGRG